MLINKSHIINLETKTGIYCLNLKRSPERRQMMTVQAEKLGLNIDFIEAIDGQNLNEDALENYNYDLRRRLGHFLKVNEVACSMSHQKALRTFLNSQYDFAIILEDDVKIESNLISVFEACAQIPSWDVLHLGIQYGHDGKYSLGEVLEGYNIFVPRKVTRGGIGLAYSRQGAEKILSLNETIHYQFDKQMALSYKSKIRHLAILPAPISVLDSPSTIGDDRLNRNQIRKKQSLYNKVYSKIVRISHSYGIRVNQFSTYRYFKERLETGRG